MPFDNVPVVHGIAAPQVVGWQAAGQPAQSAGGQTGDSGSGSTKPTPSAKWWRRLAATCKARRVLPTPPGPVSVTSPTDGCERRRCTAVISFSRPINGSRGMGRADGRRSIGAGDAAAGVGSATGSGTISDATIGIPSKLA